MPLFKFTDFADWVVFLFLFLKFGGLSLFWCNLLKYVFIWLIVRSVTLIPVTYILYMGKDFKEEETEEELIQNLTKTAKLARMEFHKLHTS